MCRAGSSNMVMMVSPDWSGDAGEGEGTRAGPPATAPTGLEGCYTQPCAASIESSSLGNLAGADRVELTEAGPSRRGRW